ncbi:MAG: pyrimidine 5'-nucleotidase [Burkholderiaceae bacterium]
MSPSRAYGRRAVRVSSVASDAPSGAPRRPVFFFDLDDTLHDASHAIFRQIDRRMTDYVERHLEVDRDEANRLRTLYWRRYGATLLGLIRHHGVDPAHFLRETHDFDIAALVRAERGLTRLFARLSGRKVLLTNAPMAYARTVLRALAVHRHFRARYTIEKMRVHGTFRPKPSRLMLRAMLARERVLAADAVLVEDSTVNLKAARTLGFRTVLMTGHGTRIAGGDGSERRRGAPRAGLVIRSLHELPRRLACLRR